MFRNIFSKRRRTAILTAMVWILSAGSGFVGCTAPEPQNPPESKVIYGDYTQKLVKELYDAKLQYIGDPVSVGKIQGLLPNPNGITSHEEGMELFTTEEPYGALRHLNWIPTEETAYEYAGEGYMDTRWASIHGMIFLALVENAGYYTYAFHNATGEGQPVQADVMLSVTVSRESCKAFFGDRDLREFAADAETFENFVSAINRYYYEGMQTEMEIYHLLNEMTDEEKQERMQEMLSGEAEKTTWETESMSYQMIHADSLVYEIAEQASNSETPFDYTDCKEYEEILKIGEPALRGFLSCFAQGRAGDGLEGHIMMYACQELLGQEKNDEYLPTEWYQLYASLDSVLLPAFRYEESVYTEELAQKHTFAGEDVQKWSIVAAGKDERLKAVYDALESKYNAKGIALGHELSVYAPMIYEIKETEDSMEVFTTILTSHQTLTRTNQGYAIQMEGGSVIPTKLEFQKRNGAWVLTNWMESMDGNRYEPSILEFCKGDPWLARKLMNSEEVQELFWQNMVYYMKAHFEGMELPIYENSYMEEALYEKLDLDIVLTYEK